MKQTIRRWVTRVVTAVAFATLVAGILPAGTGVSARGAAPKPVAPKSNAPIEVVVRLLDGVSIDAINAKYGTKVQSRINNTSIYILIPGTKSADDIVKGLYHDGTVKWAESGVLYQAQTQTFSLVNVDRFSSSAMDSFTAAVLDGFTAAAMDRFSAAATDYFSAAALDSFTATEADIFSASVLDQFSLAAADQFSAAALDGFARTLSSQFCAAALDSFNKTAPPRFSTELGQFKADNAGPFYTLAKAQFALADEAKWSGASKDNFCRVVSDWFSQSATGYLNSACSSFDASMVAQYVSANQNKLKATIKDEFSKASKSYYSAAAVSTFCMAVADWFDGGLTDYFNRNAASAFSASLLTQFSSACFTALLQQTMQDIYTAKAGDQWAFNKIDLEGAHAAADGTGITVAVVDTGADFNHWFLGNHLVPGGFDYIDGDWTPTDDANLIDDNLNGLVDEGAGHGTHIAGIIALVAPSAKIMCWRVMNDEGQGWSFIVADAIYDAVDMGVNIINLSLDTATGSQALKDAIEYAYSKGVPVVAAAGNSGKQNPLVSPASNKGVHGVSAVDENDERAAFSNYGTNVADYAAPGVGIYSTWLNGSFAWMDGTSQAAAIVSGEMALALSAAPISQRYLAETAVKVSTDVLSDSTLSYGGRVNAGAALQVTASLAAMTDSSFGSETPSLRGQVGYANVLTTDMSFSLNSDPALAALSQKKRQELIKIMADFNADVETAFAEFKTHNGVSGDKIFIVLSDATTDKMPALMAGLAGNPSLNTYQAETAQLARLLLQACGGLAANQLTLANATAAPTPKDMDKIRAAQSFLNLGNSTTAIVLAARPGAIPWNEYKKAISYYKSCWSGLLPLVPAATTLPAPPPAPCPPPPPPPPR